MRNIFDSACVVCIWYVCDKTFTLYVKDGYLDVEASKDGIHLKEQEYKEWYDLLRTTMAIE